MRNSVARRKSGDCVYAALLMLHHAVSRVFLVTCLAITASARATCFDQLPNADAAALLEGVVSIPPVGTVGQVAVWGPDAFPVMLGEDGHQKTPFIGAARHGRGRIMAWAHEYGRAAAADKGSVGRLLTNSCSWAAGEHHGPSGRVRVALLGSDLGEFLAGSGFEPATLNKDADLEESLKDTDVLVCGTTDLSAVQTGAIAAYVERGGGFVCFACPWGWAQVHRLPVAELPFNRILAPAGLVLADGTVDPNADHIFVSEGSPGDEFHAGRALDILIEVDAGTQAVADVVVKQAGATVTNAVAALPMHDQLLRPRLATLLSSRAVQLVPTSASPMKETQPLARVLLATQLSGQRATPTDQVKAHPAAQDFPGGVAATAEPIARTVVVDTRTPRWHSTGLYAPPGGVITVSLNVDAEPAAAKGLRLRIGCHTDELWHLDTWKRVPRISTSWPIDSPKVEVASPFGGLIYVEVPERATAGQVDVNITGGIEAPRFVLHKTSNDEWVKHVRSLPGPWAELACDRVILTIPSKVARKIDDPTAIMTHWVRVMDAVADLAGIPHKRPFPERYVADVQISAGYMHSGYPIMTHLDAASFMTDAKGLVESGWGPYHEMGHNHQDGMWTFDGTGEVTCNIFTLYVLENVCGVADASQQKVTGEAASRARAKYMAEGAQYSKWKRDPFLALQMYAQLRIAFGWDVYRKVFAEYRDIPKSERPDSDDEKRDQWIIRMSRATGKNLGPFFQAWGVPTSEAARASLNDLETWMPPELQKN